MPIASKAADRGRGVAGQKENGDRVGYVDVQGRGHNTVEIGFRITDRPKVNIDSQQSTSLIVSLSIQLFQAMPSSIHTLLLILISRSSAELDPEEVSPKSELNSWTSPTDLSSETSRVPLGLTTSSLS
jgi:hypothetical protein